MAGISDACYVRHLMRIMDFADHPEDVIRGTGQIRNKSRKREDKMELHSVRLDIPDGANLILGQAHFIKTAEDIYEVMVNTVPGAKFAVAFCEASGPCLIRVEANDDDLRAAAVSNAEAIAAGHVFVLLMREAYPINVLSRVRDCFEVCSIFCSTANPVEAIVAETGHGRGVLGVIDGSSPRGTESAEDAKTRHAFVRKIGYKL
ncbi:MAG: adenosine-specific kinase [Candidatus Acidiferrales bacterium]